MQVTLARGVDCHGDEWLRMNSDSLMNLLLWMQWRRWKGRALWYFIKLINARAQAVKTLRRDQN